MFLIAGASRKVGQAAVDVLRAHGHEVRVLARSQEAAAFWTSRGAHVLTGELDDAQALTSALRGVRGVYFVIPLPATTTDPSAQAFRLGNVIAAAATASGVQQIVLLALLGGVALPLYHAEHQLGAVDAGFTSVRSALFFHNWTAPLLAARRTGIFESPLALEGKVPMVCAADAARVAAGALMMQPSPGKRILEVVGPRDVSPRDIAGAASAVLGRRLAVTQLGADGFERALSRGGASPVFARRASSLAAAIDSGYAAWENHGPGRIRGETTMEAVVSEILAGGSEPGRTVRRRRAAQT